MPSVRIQPPSGRRLARQRRGISTTEILVTLAISAILISISVVALSKARKSRSQAVCAGNLHSIGIAFAGYAADYQDYFPAPTPTAQWEDLLRDYLHRDTFRCPADQELFPVLGSSYDWRDTGNPATTLAGRSHMQIARNDISLAYDMLPGWHGPGKVQVLTVDSSVVFMNQDSFLAELQRPPDQP